MTIVRREFLSFTTPTSEWKYFLLPPFVCSFGQGVTVADTIVMILHVAVNEDSIIREELAPDTKSNSNDGNYNEVSRLK